MKRLALIILLLPVPVLAQDNQVTNCQLGDAVRVIEVVYPQATALPCEVQYNKDGATNVLWRASAEAGYCEKKAAEFAEKQRGWGWSCMAVAAGNTQADTENQPEN
ncbi:hypothetical protein M2404_004037 [Rheinheimera pacifica]|uniref:hypothetical protein n=1 Tax=Rheinheimera pacifica TaxID=173990 RepID=UPI00216704D3|nr:hypothetical protein [Rheinheimera pacifica]MCS4309660.1 hypothetical protein [Rheinheimera pacifica]